MDRERDRPSGRIDALYSGDRLVAEVLLNRRRRYVLYYVYEHADPVALDDVAVQVAAWERTTTPDEVSTAHSESVSASLRQTHVPYLEERGFVTYDPVRDRLASRDDDPDVELYLANDPRTTIAWYEVYLALTAVSAVLLALVRFDVPPFGGLPPIAVAGLVVALFAVASLGHWYDVYRWRRRTEDGPPDFLLAVEEEVSYDEENENSEGNGRGS